MSTARRSAAILRLIAATVRACGAGREAGAVSGEREAGGDSRGWIERTLARLRPHRVPLTLAVDALVVVACWNFTYLFRLGFERWWSARPATTWP
jgi:hypothetical protein